MIDEVAAALQREVEDTALIKRFRQKATAGNKDECLKIMNENLGKKVKKTLIPKMTRCFDYQKDKIKEELEEIKLR